MTGPAPAAYPAAYPAAAWGAHVQRYRIDALDLPGLGRVDELGREWELTGEKGWHTPGPPRTNRTDRPENDGAYRSVAYRGVHVTTVTGTVHVPTAALLEQTLGELGALCPDPRRLYPLRRTAGEVDHVRHVEPDSAPEIDVVGRADIDFQFVFAAPDPRRHDFRWQEPRASPPQTLMNGLEYDGGGLDYAGGLDYGGVGEDQPAQVANYGTDTARPFFELRGPQPSPTIVHVESGATLRYRDDLVDGETVRLNCDEHPARGLIERSSTSTRRGDVTSLWVVPTWPEVPAQAVASFRLLTPGPIESLTAALRSAYR